MTASRLLPLLMLLALLVAPFGRIGLAEAAAPEAAPMAMTGHCEDRPDSGKAGPGAIDCMIACAAMAPATAPEFSRMLVAVDPQPPLPRPSLTGRQPEADPPPPRFS